MKSYSIEISGSGTLPEIIEALRLLMFDLKNGQAVDESIADHGDFSGEIPPLVIEITQVE